MESILSQFLVLVSSDSREEAMVAEGAPDEQVTYSAIGGSIAEEALYTHKSQQLFFILENRQLSLHVYLGVHILV